MTLSSPVAPVETPANATAADPGIERANASKFTAAVMGIFLLALSFRFYFNFCTVHSNCTFVGDASEYLREANALGTSLFWTADFWHHAFAVLTSSASPELLAQVHQQTSVLNELKVSGPVFPILILTCFAIAGKPVGIEFWQVPVAAQCVLSALTCVIVALTAARTWSKKVGIISGVVAALYPSFVISSGVLTTETFTTFLFSSMAWITTSSIISKPVSNFGCIALGLLSAALQLTRPPAAILSLLTFPFVFWSRNKKSLIVALASLLIGFSTIFLPYLVFQKIVFNTSSLIVNRRASENLFMGNSPETQGWIAMPFIWMPPDEKRTAYVINQSLRNPRQTVQLLIDKLIRLTKFPYNDQRLSIGVFVFPEQVLFHQFILIFAAIGLVLAFCTERKPESSQKTEKNETTENQEEEKLRKPSELVLKKRKARIALLTIAGSNLVYIAFVAMARYFYPAMPVVIMFAAAGFVSLLGCLRLTSAPLAATCAAAICAVLISAQLNFAVLLLKTGIVSNILLAQTLDTAVKLVPLLCIGIILIKLVRDTTNGARTAAQAVALSLLIITIPAICLPSRANGRSLETTFFLNHPGQAITQEIAISQSALQQLRNNNGYLLIDARGARALSGLAVAVNGREIPALFIPSLALVEDFAQYGHQSGTAFIWEYENILQCMTAPARISNVDLRQWFLVPVPGDAVDQKCKSIVVELKKTNYSTTTIYGEFARNKLDLSIPSPSSQSSEKAFCCVESPTAFGDPRFDTRVKLLPVVYATSAKNTPPQSTIVEAVPNIRLLVTPPPSVTNRASASIAIADLQIDNGKGGETVIEPNLPSFAKGEIALLHFHGKIKALRGYPLPHMEVQLFAQKSNTLTGYSSPWTPSVIKAENSWRDFSFTLPVAIGDLPGKVGALHIIVTDGDPHQQLLLKQESQSAFGIKDASIEVSTLPNRPTAPGYSLY